MVAEVYTRGEVDDTAGALAHAIAEEAAVRATADSVLSDRIAVLEEAPPSPPPSGDGGLIWPSGSVVTDTENLADALVRRLADLGPGRFKTSVPLVLEERSAIRGCGEGVTQIEYVGPEGAPAVIVGRGIDAQTTTTDDHQHITGLEVIGGGRAACGLHLQPAYAHVADVWATSGFGRSGFLFDTQRVPGTGAVHNRVAWVRLKAKGIAFDNLGPMTDMEYDEVTFLKPDYTAEGVPDFHATNSGGGQIMRFHHNGAAGSCIRLDKAMATSVGSIYGDGFGCLPATGGLYAVVDVGQLVAGDGGSGVTISHLRNRHRVKENTKAASYVDVRVGGGMAGAVDIHDLETWGRVGPPSVIQSEQFVLDLDGRHRYKLAQINPDMSNISAIYRGAPPPDRVVAASEPGV